MKRFAKTTVWIAAALLFAGQLSAQPVDPASPSGPTADEMTKRADALPAQIRVHEQHVQHLQTLARKEKDVIKLSCVNDRYVKLKAEANLFDTARSALMASSGTDDRKAKYDAMNEAAARVQKAREEADQCVGATDLGTESGSEFTAPEIIDDPTVGLPFDDYSGVDIEPPGYASPFS